MIGNWGLWKGWERVGDGKNTKGIARRQNSCHQKRHMHTQIHTHAHHMNDRHKSIRTCTIYHIQICSHYFMFTTIPIHDAYISFWIYSSTDPIYSEWLAYRYFMHTTTQSPYRHAWMPYCIQYVINDMNRVQGMQQNFWINQKGKAKSW